MTTSSRKTFDAITTSPKSLQTILHCLSPSPLPKSDFCTLKLSREGIALSIGGLRSGWQAAAFLDPGLFSKYVYTPSNLHRAEDETQDEETGEEDDDFPVLLQVSLHALIECLSMFQVAVSGSGGGGGIQRALEAQRGMFYPVKGTLRLVYEGDGQPFLIIAEEMGVVTTCELTTYAPDEDEEANEITFTPTSLVSKIIMKSEWLHAALLELDSPSTQLILTFRTSPTKPHFRLSTTSDWGGAEVDYPNERNVLEIFMSERAISNS